MAKRKEQERCSYEIGGRCYTQRPLVLGQWVQFVAAIEGLEVSPAAGLQAFLAALGPRLPRVLAVVLIPEGVDLRSKDLDQLTEDLEFEILPGQIQEVVEDFFSCNPVASILEWLTGALAGLRPRAVATGSKGSASPSPPETSQSETPSSGE